MATVELGALRIEVGQIAAISSPQRLKDYLCGARDRLGVANISYRSSGLPEVYLGNALSAFTYSDEWAQRYLSQDYANIDPVANFNKAFAAPESWCDLQQLNLSISWLFQEAESYGVGRRGISAPVRSEVGTSGILSLTTFDSAKEWQEREMHYKAIASILGAHIHDRLLSLTAARLADDAMVLTTRQRECMFLLGCGSSVKQIAANLGISGTMVRAHLHSARRQLGASTIASALVKASTSGLLPRS